MKRQIATIGYEGTTIDGFIETLHRASITVLIDVREVALSRKKGFSKNQLASALAESGIEYVHLRGLGDPKEGREAARAGNMRLFQRIFARHMQSDWAQKELALAAKLVKTSRSCLMCFEADPAQCHRTIVAGHLSDMTGLTVAGLRAETAIRTPIAA